VALALPLGYPLAAVRRAERPRAPALRADTMLDGAVGAARRAGRGRVVLDRTRPGARWRSDPPPARAQLSRMLSRVYYYLRTKSRPRRRETTVVTALSPITH
jgi:hypothetical protein